MNEPAPEPVPEEAGSGWGSDSGSGLLPEDRSLTPKPHLTRVNAHPHRAVR